MEVDAGFASACDVAHLPVTGDGNDHERIAALTAQPERDLVAVDPGQANIEENIARPLAAGYSIAS